jgi:HPt (histidine-containing phosphotransfer) domain-containing protein
MSSDSDSGKQIPPVPKAPSKPQDQPQASSSAARVWAQYQDVIFDRMTAIETAATALRRAKLTDEIRQRAVLEAHRLAGSLGMFGLAEGTRLSREVEYLLGDQVSSGPEICRKLDELAVALRQVLEKGPA